MSQLIYFKPEKKSIKFTRKKQNYEITTGVSIICVNFV